MSVLKTFLFMRRVEKMKNKKIILYGALMAIAATLVAVGKFSFTGVRYLDFLWELDLDYLV